MADVTICSDFGVFECLVLSQLFHSTLSLSSRVFSVPVRFCHKGGVICISEVIGIISLKTIWKELLNWCEWAYKCFLYSFGILPPGEYNKYQSLESGNLDVFPTFSIIRYLTLVNSLLCWVLVSSCITEVLKLSLFKSQCYCLLKWWSYLDY